MLKLFSSLYAFFIVNYFFLLSIVLPIIFLSKLAKEGSLNFQLSRLYLWTLTFTLIILTFLMFLSGRLGAVFVEQRMIINKDYIYLNISNKFSLLFYLTYDFNLVATSFLSGLIYSSMIVSRKLCCLPISGITDGSINRSNSKMGNLASLFSIATTFVANIGCCASPLLVPLILFLFSSRIIYEIWFSYNSIIRHVSVIILSLVFVKQFLPRFVVRT